MNPETKREFQPLSHKEMELMELLWDAGEPLGRGEILERAEQQKNSWKPNSIHILLNQLMDKNYVTVAGYYLSSRKLGRTFQPALTRQDYALSRLCHASRLAEQEGVSLTKQIAALKAERAG